MRNVTRRLDQKNSVTVHRFLLDRKVLRWVRQQNTVHGIAPPTTAVLEAHDVLQEQVAKQSGGQTTKRSTNNASVSRMWAWRWRRCVQVRMKKLRLRKDMTSRDLEKKAAIIFVSA